MLHIVLYIQIFSKFSHITFFCNIMLNEYKSFKATQMNSNSIKIKLKVYL